MITIRSKMEDRKSSRLMETVDIMDLIPFVGNVLYITQDRALSGVRIATKLVPSCFIQRISLTGFPAQSVGSSNTDVLDLPCLLVLITGTSQSRQHVDTSLISFRYSQVTTAVLFDMSWKDFHSSL
ncbi:hypothetical protein Tco_1043323 [Tanacetum coccineum]|uniref:Uncharacterized protein n=1 Tax=Tanacetum coccineum TaxID=301880 RepID=A0ABQ5GPA5_9ASTR